MNRPVHFELHSANPEKCLSFFESVFGWKAMKFPGPQDYWVLTTGDKEPGINGGLMRSRDGNPRTVNTIKVDSVDTYTEKVTKAGGQVVVPKMAIPGVGWLAYCTDPTGNIFGVTHEDKSAK